MTDAPVLWWLTRSAGLTSMVLLTVSLVLGITATWGAPAGRALRQGLHRWSSGLAVGLVLAHIGTSVADTYVPLSLWDTVVPFMAGYRPLWVGLGTLSVDLLLAIVLTSVLRSRLKAQLWRRVHLLAYGAWPLALVHGLGSGSDARAGLVRAVTVGCIVLVLLAVTVQLGRRITPARLVSLSVVALLVAAGTGWALQGPLAPGWAKRAETWAP